LLAFASAWQSCGVSVWRFIAAIGVAAGVAAGPARADDDRQVDVIIKKAVALRRQGKDRQALSELQRAAAIASPPRLSAQTGLAEQALGLWVASDKHLRDALDHDGDDPWVRKNRRPLEQSLSAVDGHLGTLDVWGDPEGALVLVDGDPVGKLPLEAPLRVPAETIDLAVRARGFVSLARKLDVAPGASVREHVVLRLVEATPVPPAVVPAVAPAAAVTPAPPETPADAAPADESPSIFGRWWFWTIAAAVVAGGVAGGLLLTRKPASCMGSVCSSF